MAEFANDSIQGIKDLLAEIKKLKSELIELTKINKEMTKGINPAKAKAEDVEKLNKASQNLIVTEKEINKLNEQEKKLTDQLNKSLDKEVKGKLKLQKANKEQRDILKDLIVLENKEAGTLEKIAATNRKLRREREKLNLETAKGRKRLQEINAELDKNNAKIKASSDQMKKQRLNVGNYSASIKEAASQSGLFTKQLTILSQIQGTLNAIMKLNTTETEVNTASKQANKAATTGLTGAQKAYNFAVGAGSKALKLFKVALAGTGIGALLLALGGLVSFLTSTQRGMDKVSNATKGIGAAFDVLKDRLSGVGEAFSLFFSGEFTAGFDKLKESFKGIGDEIANEVDQATELDKALQRLRDREIELIGTRAELRKAVEENRLLAKDEDKTNQQRLAYLDTAIEKENELLDVQLEIAIERARIARAQLNLAESTAEEIKEVAELEAAVIELQTANLKRRRTIESERATFIRKIRAEEARRELNNEKRRIQLLEDEREQALRNEQLRFNQELKQAKDNKEDLELVELIHQQKLEEIRERFFMKKVENLKREIKTERKLITEWDDSYLKELQEKERRANEIREKNKEEAMQFAQDLTSELGEELARRNQQNIDSLDTEIGDIQNAISRQQALAEKGLDNELAFEEERLNELNLRRKEALEKQQRQEEAIKLAEAFISAFEARVQDNPDTALQKATQDVFLARSVAKALAEGFAYDGTEDTGNGKGLDEKNGKLWMVHPNERIMSKAQNQLVGDLSNEELANLAYNYRMGIPIDKEKALLVNNNEGVINEIKSLKETIKSKPVQQIDIDKLGNIIETLDNGRMKTRTRLKTRGRL